MNIRQFEDTLDEFFESNNLRPYSCFQYEPENNTGYQRQYNINYLKLKKVFDDNLGAGKFETFFENFERIDKAASNYVMQKPEPESSDFETATMDSFYMALVMLSKDFSK